MVWYMSTEQSIQHGLIDMPGNDLNHVSGQILQSDKHAFMEKAQLVS